MFQGIDVFSLTADFHGQFIDICTFFLNFHGQFINEHLTLQVHFQPTFSFRLKPSNFRQKLMAQVSLEQIIDVSERLGGILFPVFFQYPDAAVQLKFFTAAKDKRILEKPVVGNHVRIIRELGFFAQFQEKVPVFKNLQLRVKPPHPNEKVSGNDRRVKWDIIFPQKSDRVKVSSKNAVGFPFFTIRIAVKRFDLSI